MSDHEVSLAILALGVLLAGAHFMGYLFERLRQPRLVGEILTGILLGPFVLGQILPFASALLFGASAADNKTSVVLGFVSWLGLLLLMFISGSQARGVLAQENRRQTAWILGVGTPIPFFLVLFLGLSSVLPVDALVGTAGKKVPTLLILSIAVAVTSIPIISRIFYDLKILHTRFASLILGSAVLEDIILWGVLAIATALLKTGALTQETMTKDLSSHVLATAIYIAMAIFVAPSLLRRFHHSRWNLFMKSSPLGYIILILFFYTVTAASCGVNLVFAAFLAGFGVIGGIWGDEREKFSKALESIQNFSTSTFIPIYFTLVGFKLVLGREFSLVMLIIFLLGSSILALVSVGLAAKLAGFKGLDILNIAITTNARGGPGIVLASVAYDAGIINAAFYTTLVISAIFTSQFAGAWLKFVLNKGWPLLSSSSDNLLI